MGCWDCYCFICGGPIQNRIKKGTIIYDYEGNEIEVQENIKNFRWLDKLTLLKCDNTILKLKYFKYDS